MLIWQDKYHVYAKMNNFLEENFKPILSILNDSGFKYDKKTRISTSNFLTVQDDLVERLSMFDTVEGCVMTNQFDARDFIKNFDIKYDESLTPLPPKNRIQKRAIHGAIQYEGSHHHHRMGVGKTYIAIATANHFFHHNIINQMIIVTEGIVLYNWKYELLKFAKDCTEDDIYIVDTKSRKPFDQHYKYIVMSYDGIKMVMRDLNKGKFTSRTKKVKALDKVLENKNFMLVSDEIHRISNKGTSQNNAVLMLSSYATTKIGLSATPFRKVWQEKYQHMKFISTELVFGMDYSSFVRSTAVTKGEFSSVVKVSKPEKQAKWDKFWEPLIFTGQLDIEAKNHIKVIWIEMDDVYEQMYKDIAQRRIDDIIAQNGYLDSAKTLGMFIHMLMALSDFSLVDHVMDGLGQWDLERNPKYDIVKDLLKTHIEEYKERVVLWQGNPKLLDQLGEKFHKYKPDVVHGKSGHTKEERNQLIVDFNTIMEKMLLIANNGVMGTGTNIQGANISAFWGIDYDYIKFDQTTGRIYREGQENDCTQYVILFKNSIEESAWWAIQNKASLNSLTLQFKSFSKTQIKDVLTGKIYKVFSSIT